MHMTCYLHVLYQATPTKHMFNIEQVHLAMAVNSATVQAISTALAGSLSPLLKQFPMTTAIATLTGHLSIGGVCECCACVHRIEGAWLTGITHMQRVHSCGPSSIYAVCHMHNIMVVIIYVWKSSLIL